MRGGMKPSLQKTKCRRCGECCEKDACTISWGKEFEGLAAAIPEVAAFRSEGFFATHFPTTVNGVCIHYSKKDRKATCALWKYSAWRKFWRDGVCEKLRFRKAAG